MFHLHRSHFLGGNISSDSATIAADGQDVQLLRSLWIHQLSSVHRKDTGPEEVDEGTWGELSLAVMLCHPLPRLPSQTPWPPPVTKGKISMGPPKGTNSPTFTLTCNRVGIWAGNIYTRPLLQKINANHAEQFEGAYVLPPASPLFKG